jgi:hypothetical protein
VAPDLLDLFASARQSNGSVSEPAPECVDGDERAMGGEQRRAAGLDACPVAGFERSQAQFGELIEWVAGEQALGLEHSNAASLRTPCECLTGGRFSRASAGYKFSLPGAR